MSENSLPPEALVDVFWPKDDFPTSFPPALSPEVRRKLLHEIAQTVFERRRRELAYDIKASQVLELIALIISKTYAGRGDLFQLADDVALMRISDLLLEHNPHLIRRYTHEQITEQQLLRQLQMNQASIE
jgi:hypothetical protein